MSGLLLRDPVQDRAARRAAVALFAAQADNLDDPDRQELAVAELVAADAAEFLSGLDLPELARAVLVERVTRRLTADSIVMTYAAAAGFALAQSGAPDIDWPTVAVGMELLETRDVDVD